jgi:hypothetical protein
VPPISLCQAQRGMKVGREGEEETHPLLDQALRMQVAEEDVDEKKKRKQSERRIYTSQSCVCTLSSLGHHHAQHTHHPISLTATHHIQTHLQRHLRINPIITSCDKIARHLLHMSAYHTLLTKNSMARPIQIRRPAHTVPPKTTREWSHIIIP